MHVSLTVCKAFDLLSNSEPLLLIDYATQFIYGGQKKTAERSYLELTLVRLQLSGNLLVSYAFSCQVLVSVLSRRVISWKWRKS